MFALCYLLHSGIQALEIIEHQQTYSVYEYTVLPHCYSDVSKNNVLHIHIAVLQCIATSLSKPVHHTKNFNITSATALINRLRHSDIKSNMSFLGTFYA
jgi:hypothetical protein